MIRSMPHIGLSEENGSWNTGWLKRRRMLRSAREVASTFRALQRELSPLVAFSSPRRSSQSSTFPNRIRRSLPSSARAWRVKLTPVECVDLFAAAAQLVDLVQIFDLEHIR